MALGKEVTVIEKKPKRAKKVAAADKADALVVEQEEEEGLEVEDLAASDEDEYVPIDAMYRDELEFEAADGEKVRGCSPTSY